MRKHHCIRTYSKTQTTIFLSSAQAELGGIVTAASQSIGLQSVANDLGFSWGLGLKADASAAIGICRRRGLGKARHLHVADLWVQNKLKSQAFSLDKTPGCDNVADALTKYLDQATIKKYHASMSIKEETGRATTAPKIASNQEDDAAQQPEITS